MATFINHGADHDVESLKTLNVDDRRSIRKVGSHIGRSGSCGLRDKGQVMSLKG